MVSARASAPRPLSTWTVTPPMARRGPGSTRRLRTHPRALSARVAEERTLRPRSRTRTCTGLRTRVRQPGAGAWPDLNGYCHSCRSQPLVCRGTIGRQEVLCPNSSAARPLPKCRRQNPRWPLPISSACSLTKPTAGTFMRRSHPTSPDSCSSTFAVPNFSERVICQGCHLPHGRLTEHNLASYASETLFVVYCSGPHCNGADKAAVRLARLGRPMKKMIGGITGWKDEGFDLVESVAAPSTSV